MNAARFVSRFSSFVPQNREYAHISQWTFKSWEYIIIDDLHSFCAMENKAIKGEHHIPVRVRLRNIKDEKQLLGQHFVFIQELNSSFVAGLISPILKIHEIKLMKVREICDQ